MFKNEIAEFIYKRTYSRWLEDEKRFLWSSERTGYKTYELWDVDSGQLAVLGSGKFHVWGTVGPWRNGFELRGEVGVFSLM